MTANPFENIGAIPVFSLADRLRKAREFRELTQGELAAAMGVSPKTISRYELEAHKISMKRPVLLSWALATGVSLEWILTGETKKDPGAGPGSESPNPDLNRRPFHYKVTYLRAVS